MTSTDSFASSVLSLPSSAGATVLVGIDGFSGAGKTALADELGTHDDITVVSIEEFYPGWAGLAEGPARAVTGLVDPLRRGETPRWRAWDWENDTEGPASERPVRTRVVVLEGCGAGARVLRPHEALTVWVDAEPDERERRLRAREDWTLYAPHRADWRATEQALAAQEGLPEAADVVLRRHTDGSLEFPASPRR
jgi:cytidylate kinase